MLEINNKDTLQITEEIITLYHDSNHVYIIIEFKWKNKYGVYTDYTNSSYICGIFIKFRLKEYEVV